MNFQINKEYFPDINPSESVKERVMSHVHSHTWKKTKSLVIRYKHRYKITVLPVLGLFFIFGGYLLYQNTHTSLEQEILQTKNAINDFVSMDDYEIL